MAVRDRDGATERRPRLEAPRTAGMLNPGDFYTMTDTLQDPRPSLGRPKATAGLGTTPRPGRMQHRVFGKKVVEAVRIDAGQTLLPGSGMLKSRGCDAMTGASGSFSEWSSK